jgi:hypothetical protein
MAAEPEKKVDKLLHAYARKRRGDAGEPLEVHPATRRMLQGEVAKLQAGKAETERPWWRSLLLMWPRFAAAFAIFMMLAVCVWVFVQNENRKQGVTELAARRAPAADQPAAEESIRLREKAEPDGVAGVQAREETDAKKVSEKSPTILALDNKAKEQLGDAEKPMNAPMPTGPALDLGKNVKLKLESPAQQTAKSDETLLAAAGNEKRADLDGSARVLKQNPADNYRLYRQADSSGVKLEDTLTKGGLGVPPSSTVTAGVTLAVPPPTEAYLNFAYTETNVGLVPALGRLGGNVSVPNAGTTSLGDLVAAPGLQTATVVATEWAAAADRQLAENEVLQGRGLERAQQFGRRDANGTPILQRFAVEQINERIRIRDGDGSVYEGIIVTTTGVEALKESKDELSETRVQRKLSDPNTSAVPIRFRASGTNRARQLVVINGEMRGAEQLARSNQALDALSVAAPQPTAAAVTSSPAEPRSRASTVAGQSGAVGGRASSPATAGTVSSVSSATNAFFKPAILRARVQIGRTNEVELNAIRTK